MSVLRTRPTTRCRAGRARPARFDESGSGTVLIMTLMLVAMLLGTAVLIVSGYRVAAVQARAGADSAAFSGAQAAVAGADGCAVAASAAQANGVELVECSEVGDALDLVVSVRVEAPVSMPVAGLPESIPAIAHAGSLQTVDPP
ncbi:Rv3654c family TadE-like protein [Naumannella halotolerans]|uniref:Secretion/DNA translocation related TadE-like protein n=1 Tax=Naumannella halotolerans TaxID=993414 RepID=A0A4R7IYP7_9ACTN|nr:Rv3654c family TadE-like protein [Naumannella halotolerans]TDT29901.1 secretion/DNA translocation related TadE-like protein [Naumannella halotolerans]